MTQPAQWTLHSTAGQLHSPGIMWPVSTLLWVSSFLPPPIHSSMVNLVEGGAELVGVVGCFSWEFAWLLVSDFERQVSSLARMLDISMCSQFSPEGGCFLVQSIFIAKVAWLAGMLPVSKYHQVSSSVSKDEVTSENDQPSMTERRQSVRNKWSGADNSISLEESSADRTPRVHHQGKVLVHHQFKGSVLVRFPDPPTSESGSAVHQGRKDLTHHQGQEMAHHQSKAPSYNKYEDMQSDHGHHPSKQRTLPMADNHPDNLDDKQDGVQPSEQSDDQLDDLQEENYQPGDRVKSRIQLWESKVEGTKWEAKVEGPRSIGKAGRQVNQVQPFSLRDEGQKHEFDPGHHNQDQNHRNQIHHHHENQDHLDHGLGNHYHENHDQRNHQHHNHQKYSHGEDQMQVQDTSHKKYQVHNHNNNHIQVTSLKPSHIDDDNEETYLPKHQNGRKENIHIQAGGIRTNGKTSKDEERERVCGGRKENLGKITASKGLPMLSKPKKNQLSQEILFKEPQAPSERADEAFQTKTESENEELKPQESPNLKKEGWNSKFSGILGGQGGLGWVQGEHLSN